MNTESVKRLLALERKKKRIRGECAEFGVSDAECAELIAEVDREIAVIKGQRELVPAKPGKGG